VKQASSLSHQSGASSSPSSSHLPGSDPGPVVDISHDIFQSRLKTFVSQLSQPGILPLDVWQSLAVVVLVSAAD